MALRTPEKPNEYNPTPDEAKDDFQNIVDQNFSPGDQKAMEERAIDGAAEDIKNNSNSTADDLLNSEQGIDSADKKGGLEDQENSGDANWNTNVSTKGTNKVKGLTKNSKIAIAVFGLMFAVFGLIFSIMTGAMGIVQLKENMLSKMSQRGADALERRKARVMAKKFSKDITRGVCSSTVKIKCRYRGMNEREIKKFNKRAERAGLKYRIDSDGRSTNPLKKSIRIVEIDPKTGKETFISADKYRELIRTNPDFRKAFNAFYKGNVQYHAGRAGSFVLAKYKVYRGKIKAPKGEGDSEKAKAKYSLRKMVRQAVSGATGQLEASKIAPSGATDPAGEVGPDDIVSEEVRKEINDDINKEKSSIEDVNKNGDAPIEGSDSEQNRYKNIVEKIKNKGGGITGLANPVAFMQPLCMVRMIAAASASAKSVLQSVQLIKFSMQYAVLADQIKAGDADEDTLESTGLLMGMLSEKDERGFTAFDSLGYNWIMSQNGAVRGTLNENVGRYQNGGYTAGSFGPAVTAVSSDGVLKKVCGVAMSKTATVIGIGITLIPGVGSIFKGGATAAMKTVLKAAIEKNVRKKMSDIIDKQIAKTVLKQKVSTVAKAAGAGAALEVLFSYGLPPLINSLSKSLAGTVVTGDEKGTDAGNALVSGFGATTSQTGKAQGMMPLNPDRAVATDNFAYENQLKLAKEDGINPLDFTNRFSFANQFATNVLPLQAKFSSITSLPAALSNISSSALSLTFSKGASAATDKKKQYTYCTDADEIYSEKNIATDPMCNPIYGLPAAVKDIDPEAVVDYLSGEGLIDEESGEPKEEFTEFIEKCITPQTPYGDEDYCLKGGGLDPEANHLSDDDRKYAMMRLYCVDTSIDVDMNDGEGVSCIPKVESNSELSGVVEDESAEMPSGDARELAQQLLDNPNVTYPYTDTKGVTAKDVLESIAITGKGIVNSPDTSLTSVAVNPKMLQALVEYAKNNKIGLNPITNADHSSTSNHYKGIAVDLNCTPELNRSGFDKIASKYGGKNNGEVCPTDAHWHYDFPYN